MPSAMFEVSTERSLCLGDQHRLLSRIGTPNFRGMYPLWLFLGKEIARVQHADQRPLVVTDEQSLHAIAAHQPNRGFDGFAFSDRQKRPGCDLGRRSEGRGSARPQRLAPRCQLR